MAVSPMQERRPLQIALVEWRGDLGGREVLSSQLAATLRRHGVEAEIVFVESDGPLAERLTTAGVPFRTLGLGRGRDLLRNPRRFARGLAPCARDGAILPECGFIGGALRVGGFRAPIVAVEHGALLHPQATRTRRILHGAARHWAAWADDVEVAVSDFTLARMRAVPHARRVCRIYNGIDPSAFNEAVTRPRVPGTPLTLGFVGRLIPGKGLDRAIEAVAVIRRRLPARLRVAGDGPDRDALLAMVDRLQLAENIEFVGAAGDVRPFWRDCDVAIFPSDRIVESFGMSALEAMACGKPVVATRNGGVPEVVLNGVTGLVVTPADSGALAEAIIAYAEDEELRQRHGAAGRDRAVEVFDISICAGAYLELLATLSR